MTVREYIGARYVPLFMGEWDNTAAYEPLSIVQYQGNSYTSRQSVPVGIPITNELYWAQTGNYNAQIEAYRAEVQGFEGRISDLENTVKRVEDDTLYVGIPLIKGSCTLVKAEDKAFLVDCGDAGDGSNIASFLTEKAVSRLDAVIISHFHHDHFGAFSEILNFIDADTDIYIQMALPQTNDEYASYQASLTTLNQIVANNNLKTPITPVDSRAYVYGNVKLTMYNTDASNRAAYENSWANNGNYATRTTSDNNYSLISRFDYYNSSYVDCGDVEGAAQLANFEKMYECTCVKIPHHLNNYMGYYKFFDRLNPDAWIYNLYDNDLVSEPDIYGIYSSWHYRYVKFRNLRSIYANAMQRVEFYLSNDTIFNRSGYEITQDGKTFDSVENQSGYTLYMMLPPEYYNDNPYYIHEISLQDFVRKAKSLPYMVEVSANYSSEFIKTTRVYQDLEKIFSGYTNSVFRIIGGNTSLIVKINTSYGQYYCAELYNNVDADTKEGYRLFTEGNAGNKICVFDTPITTNGTIPQEGRDLLHCSKLAFRIASNKIWIVADLIPPTNNEQMPTTRNQWYRGMYISTANMHFYYIVESHGSNLVAAKSYNALTQETTDVDIDALMIVA